MEQLRAVVLGGGGKRREGQCQLWRKPVPTSLRWDKSPSTPRKKSANPCIRSRARRNLSYQLSLSLLLLLRTTTSLAQNHFKLDFGVNPPSLEASNLTLWSHSFSRKLSFSGSIRVAKKNRCARKGLYVTLFAFLQSGFVRDGQKKCYHMFFSCFITRFSHALSHTLFTTYTNLS